MLVVTRRGLHITLGVLFVALVIVYGYFKLQDLVQGPHIAIIEPQTGTMSHEPLVTISGETKNTSHITLNGEKIYVNTDGAFNEEVLLLPGYNLVEVYAEDRFQKPTQKTIELVYTPRTEPPLATHVEAAIES